MVNKSDIKEAIKSLIEAIGEDPKREGLADTPRRIAEMYDDIFSGVGVDPCEVMATVFDEGHHEFILPEFQLTINKNILKLSKNL